MSCRSSSLRMSRWRRLAPRHLRSMIACSLPLVSIRSARPLMGVWMKEACKGSSVAPICQSLSRITLIRLQAANSTRLMKFTFSGSRPYISNIAPSLRNNWWASRLIHWLSSGRSHSRTSCLSSRSNSRWAKFPIRVLSLTILSMEDFLSLILCRNTHW